MKKRVVDLDAAELSTLAGEAWSDAAKQALASGHCVTGSRDGRRLRFHPDGRVEDLGPVVQNPALAQNVASDTPDLKAAEQESSRKSVA